MLFIYKGGTPNSLSVHLAGFGIKGPKNSSYSVKKCHKTHHHTKALEYLTKSWSTFDGSSYDL